MYNIKLKFYLKPEQTPGGVRLLMLRVTHKGARVFHSTGLNLLPGQWDHDKQRVVRHPARAELNGHLDSLRLDVQRLVLEAHYSGAEPLAHLKASFNPQPAPSYSVVESFAAYIEGRRGTHQTGTLKTYGQVLNLLKEFEAHTGQPITFDALGLAFGEAFTTYLTGTVGQSNSTAEKRLKILKTFLLDCQRRGLITEVKLGKPAYLKKIEATHVALSGAELNRLESLDLAHHPRLARVRDVFCFGCHTGLRFSDLCQLRPEHLQTLTDTVGQPVRALVLPMQKTARRITVPLNAYASSIVERHGLPLPTLTNQRTNDYLKELCQLAGFSTPVVLEQMKGATRVQTAHPKHELITTHTARRTFATLARERGMPWEVLRDCLGHRSIAETERYVKSTLATQLTETLNTWR